MKRCEESFAMNHGPSKHFRLVLWVCSHLWLVSRVGSIDVDPDLIIAPVIDGRILPVDQHLRWSSGTLLNLTCTLHTREDNGVATDEQSLSQISWRLPVKMTSTDKSFVEIPNVSKSNSGTYQCSAVRSNKLLLSATLFLDVWTKAEREICGFGFFQCPNNGHCIKQRFVCDGRPDCQDGADESEDQCGYSDPCKSKLRCDDGRCMDPKSCCDPLIHPNCTVAAPCCEALLESNRHFFQYGLGREHEIRFLHSTIYTIIGCVLAFIFVLLLVAFAVCRLQVKRGWSVRRSGGWTIRFSRHDHPIGSSGRNPPITRADLDLYFAYLQRVDSLGHRFNGITYNVNNGVQVVGAPPPYSAAVVPNRPEPPPPYVENEGRLALSPANQARVVTNPPGADATNGDQAQPLLENNNNEDNNNGDINGNSDMVDHNEVRRRELQEEPVE